MKKYFLIFFIMSFSFFSLFSASDVLINGSENYIIKVLGEVKTENYVAEVYYNEEKLNNNLTVLDNESLRFDISKPGRTKEFRIVIIGNQTEPKSLEVIIQGQQFIGSLGTQTENIDTNLYVNAIKSSILDENIPNNNIPYIGSLNIPKGIHTLDENVIETRFVLAWKGNDTLPAGFYTSDIDIEYSVID